MAPQLGAPALLEDPGLSPSIHTVTHNICNVSSGGLDTLFQSLEGPGTQAVHRHTCRECNPMHKTYKPIAGE